VTRPLGSVCEAAGAHADACEPDERERGGVDEGADGGISPVDAVRGYRLRIVPAVDAVAEGRAHLRGGVTLTPDAVMAATGYRADLGGLVGHLGVLDERGLPMAGGGETAPGQPGLFFTGYRNPLTGALRELPSEAPAIAAAVAAEDG
jgi:putative flavoprotein involved in K+ transport